MGVFMEKIATHQIDTFLSHKLNMFFEFNFVSKATSGLILMTTGDISLLSKALCGTLRKLCDLCVSS